MLIGYMNRTVCLTGLHSNLNDDDDEEEEEEEEQEEGRRSITSGIIYPLTKCLRVVKLYYISNNTSII